MAGPSFASSSPCGGSADWSMPEDRSRHVGTHGEVTGSTMGSVAKRRHFERHTMTDQQPMEVT